MDALPWWIWIVFAGMAFGLTMAILTTVQEQQRKLAKLNAAPKNDEVIATNRAVLDKLESIEGRIANLEKTLNDIPS